MDICYHFNIDQKEKGNPLRRLLLALCTGLFLSACSHPDTKTIKVAASPVPHSEILQLVVSDLKEKGITLEIIDIDDYQLPNRLLAEKKVDANFFQHEPFLNEQKKTFGYKIVAIAKVHVEPLGIYSDKITSLDGLRDGAVVAVPSDPTNEARALELLEREGLIKLKSGVGLKATIHDITENPKKLKIKEVDAPFLARALPDIDLGVIPSNFAIQVGLCPPKDALAMESGDSPYANVLVIREADLDRPELRELASALQSPKIKEFFTQKHCGALQPAF